MQTLVDGKPGRLLPFCGGPVRFAGILWRAHEMSPVPGEYHLRSQAFLESAIELILLGVLGQSYLTFGDLESDDARLAQAIFSRASARAQPDLSYSDELQLRSNSD